MFQHVSAPVGKLRFIKTWLELKQIGVEELEWPDQSPALNPNVQIWDELECLLANPNNVSTKAHKVHINAHGFGIGTFNKYLWVLRSGNHKLLAMQSKSQSTIMHYIYQRRGLVIP